LSATSPFEQEHLAALRTNAPAVVRSLFPEYEDVYRQRGWRMLPAIDRIYVNRRARDDLDWRPRVDFQHAIAALRRGDDVLSPLARAVGSKGYHRQKFERSR
jgi:UDP-glucose 4-epimerase